MLLSRMCHRVSSEIFLMYCTTMPMSQYVSTPTCSDIKISHKKKIFRFTTPACKSPEILSKYIFNLLLAVKMINFIKVYLI